MTYDRLFKSWFCFGKVIMSIFLLGKDYRVLRCCCRLVSYINTLTDIEYSLFINIAKYIINTNYIYIYKYIYIYIYKYIYLCVSMCLEIMLLLGNEVCTHELMLAIHYIIYIYIYIYISKGFIMSHTANDSIYIYIYIYICVCVCVCVCVRVCVCVCVDVHVCVPVDSQPLTLMDRHDEKEDIFVDSVDIFMLKMMCLLGNIIAALESCSEWVVESI